MATEPTRGGCVVALLLIIASAVWTAALLGAFVAIAVRVFEALR